MRLHDGRIVPNFIYQSATNQDMTIYGDGSQTRSFCYVEDLVRGGIYAVSTIDALTAKYSTWVILMSIQ